MEKKILNRVDFINDVMNYIYHWRERLNSGEDTIPTFEEGYGGIVDESCKPDYEIAVEAARDYFKVYWKANDMSFNTEDGIVRPEKPISVSKGRAIVGITPIDDGIITYTMVDADGNDLGDGIYLDDFQDINRVIVEFLSGEE